MDGGALEKEIRNRVEAILSHDPSLFVVGISLKGTGGGQRLLVLLDGDQGVTIDQCSEVSRKLGAQIEEEELIRDQYTLEVSSAGVDHPLGSERQYRKNIGRNLRVTLKDGAKVEGKLLEVKSEEIMVEIKLKKETVQQQIATSNIDKSIVLVSFK